MANEFREFLNFVHETTGRYPEKFANSFQDIYIYVPSDKTPPNKNDSSSSRRTMSIQNYFSSRNKYFRQLIYNEDWNHLESHLGSKLLRWNNNNIKNQGSNLRGRGSDPGQNGMECPICKQMYTHVCNSCRFCFSECIFAKRTKAGSFVVSNLSNLRNKITANPPQRLNQLFYISAICCKENTAAILNKDKTQKWEEYRTNLNHLFCPNDIAISTDDILFKISRSTKFSGGHTLVKKNIQTKMSLQVINTRVGNCKIVEFQDCVEPLELILKKLKKSHNKYNYEKALSELATKKVEHCGRKTDEDQNFGKQLPLSTLKKYFTNICRCVIPRALFGSNKNINTVIKLICELLETPKSQSVSLKPFILKMRISDMTWLSGVKNVDSQWSILGKLLKWLFNKFILEIFRTQLYIMTTNSSKKVYFMQRDWQKLITQFLRKMREGKVIVSTNGLDTKSFCDGRWILFPKKTGVRPIMSRIRGSKRGEDTKIALCYLQQLYTTKYGKSLKQTFLEKWRNLVDKFRNGENKTMYLVFCDIQYAYESIDQKKLMTIVESLADSTGPELRLSCYKIAKNLKAVKSDCFKLKECFTYPELELPTASKSIFAYGSDQEVKVSKKALLHEIRQNVLNQNILLSNQKYLLQEGIAQGATLSSVLCDVYYAHMEEANLSRFKDEGFLYRYVDDFLFATEDKALAERFLQNVNKGFPEYNCSFNAAKTWTNLPGHERTLKVITFLGFNINPETLEVTPEYSKSVRYSTLLSRPQYKVMETFHKRLSNLASLKLDGIILDRKINSEDTIICNIKCVFMRQAERCLWLLKTLFDDIPGQLSEIFGIIKSTNLQIIRRVQRYFFINGYDFEKLVPRLAVIPWKSYRQVFGKMQTIHIHFRFLFLKSITLNEHAVAAGGSRHN